MEKVLSTSKSVFTKERVLLGLIFVFGALYTASAYFNLQTELILPFVLLFLLIFILQGYFAGFLSIIVLTMIFEHFFTLAPLTLFGSEFKIYALDFIIIFSIISYFLHERIRNKRRITFGSLKTPLLIFAGLCLFSFIYGVLRGGDAAVAFSSFKNYALYAVLYIMTINFVNIKDKLRELINTILVTGLGLTLFIVVGIVRGEGIWAEYNILSTEGARLIAASHGFYLGIVVLFALPLYLSSNIILKKWAFPVIVFQIFGIIISLSRHLWIGLAVSLALIFILVPRIQKKKMLKSFALYGGLFIAGLSVLVWGYALVIGNVSALIPSDFFANIAQRFSSISFINADDPSGLWRLFLWQKSLALLAQSPFIGIGFGSAVTFDFLGYPIDAEVRSMHNSFLGILVQMGAIGLLAFLALIAKIFYGFVRNFKQMSGIYKAIAIGALANVIYFLILANFGVYFELNSLVVFFWILVGILEVSIIFSKREHEKSNRLK
ncbi:O-antigen ligase family protein [Patescibacteria group bacterium]|nr:O-antigen ligase family protein [Patescibacteria group bacterium]